MNIKNPMKPPCLADIHLHLDGAITPEIALHLSNICGEPLPSTEKEALSKALTVPKSCQDLNTFLSYFDLPLSLLQTPDALTEAVRLVLAEQQKHHVVYAEIRFAPALHTKKGMTVNQAVEAAIRGLDRAPIHGNLILCCMRGRDHRAGNRLTVDAAKHFLVSDGGVVAADLAGAEGLYPTHQYLDLMEYLRENAIPFTIHAGEADGANSVDEAITNGARRIGHGVRINECEETVRHAIDLGITLEMCPTSNRITGVTPSLSRHPLRDYLHRGLLVTLNTDDPALEGTTLPEEFQLMGKEIGLTPEEAEKLLLHTADAAFTSDAVKRKLRASLTVGSIPFSID